MSPWVSRAVLQVYVSGRVLVYPVLINHVDSLVHIADYKSDLVAGLCQN